MVTCHRELQGLVSEGRGVIAQTIHRSQQLIYANAGTLHGALQDLETQAKGALREQLDYIHAEFDTSAALLSVLEQVALADSELVTILCAAAGMDTAGDKKGNGGKKALSDPTPQDSAQKRLLFQAVSNNTADYQMLSSLISPAGNDSGADAVVPKKKAGRNAPAPQVHEGSKVLRAGLDQLEVSRLYKIVLQSGPSAAGGKDAVCSLPASVALN